MILSRAPFRPTRARRHIAWAMALAILLAGIAQAAHYHKDELTRGSTDVHCLLCLYAASSAGPPAPVELQPRIVPRYCGYRGFSVLPDPQRAESSCYDARGPPAA